MSEDKRFIRPKVLSDSRSSLEARTTQERRQFNVNDTVCYIFDPKNGSSPYVVYGYYIGENPRKKTVYLMDSIQNVAHAELLASLKKNEDNMDETQVHSIRSNNLDRQGGPSTAGVRTIDSFQAVALNPTTEFLVEHAQGYSRQPGPGEVSFLKADEITSIQSFLNNKDQNITQEMKLALRRSVRFSAYRVLHKVDSAGLSMRKDTELENGKSLRENLIEILIAFDKHFAEYSSILNKRMDALDAKMKTLSSKRQLSIDDSLDNIESIASLSALKEDLAKKTNSYQELRLEFMNLLGLELKIASYATAK